MKLEKFRLVNPGEGTAYEFPGFAMTIVVLVSSDDSDGQYSVFESIHEPGSGAPLHIHERQHESAYVVSGEFLIQKSNKPVQRVGPGTYLHFPMGLAHAFKCVGETTGKILFWMSPGGFEKFFATAAAKIGSGPPDMAVMTEIGKEYDSIIIGPPIAAAE